MLLAIITNIISSILLLKFHNVLSINLKLFDNPNNRKIHKKKVSQFGGIIFFVNISIFYLLNILDIINFDHNYSHRLLHVGFLSYLLLFLLGYLDDRFDLIPYVKILSLIILILITVSIDQKLQIDMLNLSFYKTIYLGNLSIVFTVCCIFIFINGFNMFDGINCQSSLFIFLIILFLFFKNSNLYLLVIIFVSNSFFLFYNFKNRFFLGNNGSYSIAFLLSILIIAAYNEQKSIIYAEDIVLLMFIPIIDLFRLFVLRIFNKQNPFKADKNHIHHLILKKFGSNTTLLVIACLNIFPNIINFYFHQPIHILIITFLIYLFIIYFFDGFKFHILSKN